MVRNDIDKENFISKFILSVSYSHERLGEAMNRFDVKCLIFQIQIQIIILHYNVLHSQTEFDQSYGNPQ